MPEALVLLGVAAGSFALYETAPPGVARWAIFPYALALVLGPGWVYAAQRRRGVPGRRAVAAALLVPGVWLFKECWRVAAVHGVLESLYYALNPLALGLGVAAALQMACVEVGWRRRKSGRWRLGGVPAWVIGGALVLAAGFAGVALHDGPDVVFYAYIAGYRALFGG